MQRAAARWSFAALGAVAGLSAGAVWLAFGAARSETAALPVAAGSAALREVAAAEAAVERALAPPRVELSADERAAALAVTRAFVATAVVRRSLARSYDLVTDAYRQGLSRRQWETGDIPVQRFPGGTRIVAHRFTAREGSVVWLLVRLEPPATSGVGSHVFALALERTARQPVAFRVDSFAPSVGTLAPARGDRL